MNVLHLRLGRLLHLALKFITLGSLSNDDGNGNENVTRKYIFNNLFISFVLLRDYFNSLKFYKNGELSRNQIGRSGVQVKKETEKFTVGRSRSPQDLKPATHLAILYADRRDWRKSPGVAGAAIAIFAIAAIGV